MSYYWARIAYTDPSRPGEVIVREFQRATCAEFNEVDGVARIIEGSADLVVNLCGDEACKLISFEKDHVSSLLSGAKWDKVRDECYKLLKNNQKIPAIKVCREHTGMGLKEAKEWVEELGRTYGDDDMEVIPF